ncbi:GNAT family N-acetyltransferase, partial [Acidovorax sp.]|uniref:GNAT family N-acetyltransferase n=1 Tax=Acidovorax sp. TaxID=1872122 RepID=UPI00391FB61C
MSDLPNTTLPLAPAASSRGAIQRPESVVGAVAAVAGIAVRGGVEVEWARHLDEVRQAQKLRFDVFAGEMGARLTTPVPGHDVDLFDDYCEHLLVRDAASRQVIGTYRVLTPAQARRVGSTY